MKKLLVVAVVVTMMLMATSAFAKIDNSKHDLTKGTTSTVGYAAAGISACAFCHTPHNAKAAFNGIPLWNRSFLNTNFTLYTNASTSFNTTTQPGIGSKTCLSCHDGTVALGDVDVTTDAAGNVVAGTGRVTANALSSGAAFIGTDLSNDHPVGMTYNSLHLSAGLVDIVNARNAGAKFYTAANDIMECGTCHDPHNTTNVKFLRMQSSTICVDCHGNK